MLKLAGSVRFAFLVPVISIVALGAAVLVTTGCGDLLSLHALHTRQDQVFDTAIEGRWENDDDALEVRRDDEAYKVSLQARRVNQPPTEFELHLVDVNGVRFADLLAVDHLGHMILRVRQSGGELRVAFMDSDWLRKRVPHDTSDIENFRKQDMLTQSTPQLRGLVTKYAREPKAFGDDIVFRRAK